MHLTKIKTIEVSADHAWQSTPHPTLPLLATCGRERSVRITSLRTFALDSTIDGGHKRSVRAVAWKPTLGPTGTTPEAVLATASFDASSGIWRRFETLPKEDESLFDGELDGQGEEREEEDDWRYAVMLDGHENEVKSVAWSAGGNFLATCSRDKSVWVWEEMDDDNFETIAVLQEHTQDVKCVKWHPEEEVCLYHHISLGLLLTFTKLLASCSYDDTIRLYKEDVDDWTCCALLSGHTSTVWSIDFETPLTTNIPTDVLPARRSRLVSCSDDLTVRVWTRIEPTEQQIKAQSIPSIIRTHTADENWVQQAVLPKAHSRAIYSVAWSTRHPGRIVSCGGDGKIVVYQEYVVDGSVTTDSTAQEEETEAEPKPKTEWKIVAEMENAHGVYEINHVCWAKRWDRGRKRPDEEMVVSTGDDGNVSFWAIDE